VKSCKDYLDEKENEGKLFLRWTQRKDDITKNSFETYDRVIYGNEDVSVLAHGLYKAGYIPDDIEDDPYEWEEHVETLLEDANNGNHESQKKILASILYSNQNIDNVYGLKTRKINDKTEIGLEANGVNVTYGGGVGGGVPKGIKYLSYLKGEIIGDNFHNDGLILKNPIVMATINNKTGKMDVNPLLTKKCQLD